MGYSGNGSTGPGCYQSADDYPHLLAAQFGLALTDVSCSGALATNITTPQVTPSGTASPQQDALGPDTDIVTVTLGGNDLDFAGVATFCVASTANGPVTGNFTSPNCKAYYDPPGGPNQLADNIVNIVTPHVRAALAAISAAAPRAKVFVVGYPAITPDAANTPVGGCFRPFVTSQFIPDSYPFTDVDVPFLHSVEQQLDTAIQTETAAAGFTFIPTFASTVGHTPCAPTPAQYVEGITMTLSGPQPGSLHPNPTGVASSSRCSRRSSSRLSPRRPRAQPHRSQRFPRRERIRRLLLCHWA